MTLAPMGGDAPAAALVVAAAALPSSPHNRCARGARHSLARPPRLCALSARLPPLAQMAARSGRKRLRARRGGFAAPPLSPLAPAPASVCAASSGGGACSPLRAAAPPPLLRPRPPLSVGGGGCGFHVSAAAGLRPLRRARKRPPLVGRSWRKHNIWCLPYLTAVFLLSHLVTQSAQEMSPVMFRQVRPMSNRRSTP